MSLLKNSPQKYSILKVSSPFFKNGPLASLLVNYKAGEEPHSRAQNLKNLIRKLNLTRKFVDTYALHAKYSVRAPVSPIAKFSFNAEDATRAQAQLETRTESFLELLELGKNDPGTFSTSELHEELHFLTEEFDQHFNSILSSLENATSPCLMTLTAGAGGVDSDDLVSTMRNMYMRHALRHQRHVHCIEATQRTTVLEIEGHYAYAWYRHEEGIHRLIRLNPSNIRHSAFASVSVTPTFPEVPLHIHERDLEFQTLRASGKGGQYVNKTESAIRLTHIPSGISIKCQQDRSQHANKVIAMKLLHQRLLLKRMAEDRAANSARRQSFQPNTFGSQIRSYILHPHTLIKDHVTGLSTNQAEQIFMGETELDCFLEASIFQGLKNALES